jgi:choline dehydrogenase-like flavoprotein
LSEVDACVIGSGSGGGVVAKELGEAGFKVVVLEAGRRLDPLRDYAAANIDWEMQRAARDKEFFNVPSLSLLTSGNKNCHDPVEAHGVGGSTLKYLAFAIRMRPDDFRTYSMDGVGTDWPISYEDLVPFYRKVELELGVSGDANDPWTPLIEPYPNPAFKSSYAHQIIQRGCEKLGIRLWPLPVARLSRPYDGRPKCVQCGMCDMGCMTRAKCSMDVTYIPKAEATGRVIVRPLSIVTRILVGKDGKAKGVIFLDEKGVEHELNASIIIVSAGAIQSPRLLLNSRSNLFPDGLANSSGLVGKYFMMHFGVRSTAIFSERIDEFRGFLGGPISQDFNFSDSRNNYVRGYRIDVTSGASGPVSLAGNSRLWGNELKQYMRRTFGHAAGIHAAGEPIGDIRNCVDVDPEIKDEFGLPAARITMEWRENEKRMSRAMEEKLRDILDAAGPSQILEMRHSIDHTSRSTHNAGSCRMGNDPKTSVLNSFCQTHDISNLFVIDASCFVTIGTANPSLTIHAIAARASKYIIDEAKRGNL